MSRVMDILAVKGSQVLAIGRNASVLDAATLMNDHKIGGLVVLENRRVAGMFTERDVLRRVVAAQRDPASTSIESVMTDEVVCCTPETTIEEARTIMRNRRVRHLPVVDDERNLSGLISIGDLNAWMLDGQQKTIHYLEEYLYGRV